MTTLERTMFPLLQATAGASSGRCYLLNVCVGIEYIEVQQQPTPTACRRYLRCLEYCWARNTNGTSLMMESCMKHGGSPPLKPPDKPYLCMDLVLDFMVLLWASSTQRQSECVSYYSLRSSWMMLSSDRLST